MGWLTRQADGAGDPSFRLKKTAPLGMTPLVRRIIYAASLSCYHHLFPYTSGRFLIAFIRTEKAWQSKLALMVLGG